MGATGLSVALTMQYCDLTRKMDDVGQAGYYAGVPLPQYNERKQNNASGGGFLRGGM